MTDRSNDTAPPNPLKGTLDLLRTMGVDVRGKDPERAADCFRQASDLARTLQLGADEGQCLTMLGTVLTKKGDLEDAREVLERGLALVREHGSPIDIATTLTAMGQLGLREGGGDDALRSLRESLAQLTDVPSSQESARVRADTLEQLGAVYREKGEPVQAMRYVQEALEIRRSDEDEAGIAYDLNSLGQLHYRMGQNQEATSYFREAMARWPDESRRGRAATANNLGLTLLRLGELTEAQTVFEESRSLFSQLGETRTVAGVGTNLGLLAELQGRLEEAEGYCVESLRLFRTLEDLAGQSAALDSLSFLAIAKGVPERAIDLADESLGLQRSTGLGAELSRALCNKAMALIELGRSADALDVSKEAVEAANKSGSDDLQADALAMEASAFLLARKLEFALRSAQQAIPHAERTRDPKLLSRCYRTLGHVFLERGELEEAKQPLAQARYSLRGWETPLERPLIMMDEARLMVRAGSIEAGAERLRRATEDFTRLGNARWRIRALLELSNVVATEDPAQSRRCEAEAVGIADSSNLKEHFREVKRSLTSPVASELDSPMAPISEQFEHFTNRLLAMSREGRNDPGDPIDAFADLVDREFDLSAGEITLGSVLSRDWMAYAPVQGTHSFERFDDEDLIRLRLLSQTGSESGVSTAVDVTDGSELLVRLELTLRDSSEVSEAELRLLRVGLRFSLVVLETILDRARRSYVPRVEIENDRFEELVGVSEPMREVYRLVSSIAPSETSVMILGESGTGKELLARSIHARSGRSEGPFVPINCPSIPKDLIESELFGHEKGAFTGAVSSRPGRVELADGGTLFLDEVGDMALPTQVKLLRFLQEREFQRVGGDAFISVDVRIVAATSRDLVQMMETGEFREDLYYRLNVVPVLMPSLRERRDDIPILVDHFLGLASAKGTEVRVSSSVLAVLTAYDWPGNVRELRNVVEYMTALCKDDIISEHHIPSDLKARVSRGGGGKPSSATGSGAYSDATSRIGPGETLESRLMQIEASLIRATLESENWNQSGAARRLGVTESKIRNRMRQYGIQRPGNPEAAAGGST